MIIITKAYFCFCWIFLFSFLGATWCMQNLCCCWTNRQSNNHHTGALFSPCVSTLVIGRLSTNHIVSGHLTPWEYFVFQTKGSVKAALLEFSADPPLTGKETSLCCFFSPFFFFFFFSFPDLSWFMWLKDKHSAGHIIDGCPSSRS